MEQKSQTGNMVLFMVLAMLVIFSSMWLQSKFAPPPKAKQELVKKELPVAKGEKKDQQKDPVTPKQENKQPEVTKPATMPQYKVERVLLGDESCKIRAILSNLGAGINSLTLTQFKTATAMGKPEDKPLELLPENSVNPSFAIYDYANPDDKRPMVTLGQIAWKVDRQGFDEQAQAWTAVFSTEHPTKPIRFVKTFTLKAREYHVGLKIEIQRTDGVKEPLKLRYQLAGGHGLPIEGKWYTTTYRSALVGSLSDSSRFVRSFRDSRQIDWMSGSDKLADSQPIIYAGIVNQYFGSVTTVDDQQKDRNFLAWARATEEGAPDPGFGFLTDLMMRVVSKELDLKQGQPITHQYLLYHGPVKVRQLADSDTGGESIDPELLARYTEILRLNTLTDYHFPGWISENIFSPIGWTSLIISCTNLMHGVLAWLHTIIPSYGLCIIVLTLMVRGMMFPLTRRQALAGREMQEKMKLMKPEMDKLKEKHKDDWASLSRAQQELYRKHNVNPMAQMGGCLPLLIQMPIFMGLYYCLQESIHFRLAGFLWMDNLAAPDMLFWWSERIPWISSPESLGSLFYLGPYFNLLPIIAVGLMMVQQAMMMPPATDEQTAMQQKMMKYMTVFMGVMFYKVAAGLGIYFIVSSLWGLTERKLLPKSKAGIGKDATLANAASGAGKIAKPKNSKVAAVGKLNSKNGKVETGMVDQIKSAWKKLLEQASKKER